MVTLSTAERREIAGRARTLHERLQGPPNDPGGERPFAADELLEEWREVFPDRGAFEARLDRDGLESDAVREQLAATRWPADEPLPDWIDRLDALLADVTSRSPDGPTAVSVPGETAFVELLTAVADHARGRLDAGCLSGGIQPVEEWLVSRLEMVCLPALYVEFKSFVEHHDPELAAADAASVTDPPTDHYEAFVDAMFGEGFRNLCLEYPVLARLIVGVLDRWCAAVRALRRRLRADRDALARRFDHEGDVTAVEPLAEDTHAGGRFPAKVSFERGAVIYKPRPVGMEMAVSRALDRLDDHLPLSSPETPSSLPREEYGWTSVVESRDVAEEAAAERYYERSGVLLAVAYALGLTDCHYENVIASGEHPTVVDAETALGPQVAADAAPAATATTAAVSGSVLSTGLLPWSVGEPEEADGDDDAAGLDADGPAALAGFGGQGDGTHPTSRRTVEAVNTDVMAVVDEEVTVDRTANAPTVDGTVQPPAEHLDALLEGFETTYDAIQELHAKGAFDPEIADLQELADAENRVIYRPTPRYASILQSAVTRDPLRDGARLSVELERLAAPFFDGRIGTDRYWPLVAAERRALLRFDVPRFSCTPGGTALSHDGAPVGVEAETPGIDRCRRRLDRMGPADRRRQVGLVERCFGSVTTGSPPPRAEALPDDQRLRRTAIDCCETVRDAAVEAGPEPFWTAAIGGEAGSPLVLFPDDDSLYNGRAGIGLAMAAASQETGHDRFREWAVEALDPLAEGDDVPREGGGTVGVGSAVYALAVGAELLDRPAYRDRARERTEAVSADRLEDGALDLTNGTAGTLLALLAYYERYGDEAVLDRAVACGQRLLDARVEVEGHRAWTTVGGTPIAGLAHGTSGVAYALARLAAATGDDRYAEAARDGLAYVETLYEPSRSNYRNPLASGDRRYRDRWCYGRAGCELARLAVGRLLDDGDLLAEANRRLSATASAEPTGKDQLCCGTYGRAVALLEASRLTDRDPADARALVGRCLARRERTGSLSMPGHGPAVPNPTLFNGLSGVAYAQLRLQNPALPCVLLLE